MNHMKKKNPEHSAASGVFVCVKTGIKVKVIICLQLTVQY